MATRQAEPGPPDGHQYRDQILEIRTLTSLGSSATPLEGSRRVLQNRDVNHQ